MTEHPVKTRVFLSYSRNDAAFTHRLAVALTARGYEPDFDQSSFDPANIATGISAEDEWWKRLETMIAAADIMIFIVTPDSAASKICDEEIAYARGIGKRIVPILRRSIDFTKAPPRLAALNVKLNFLDDGGDAFEEALNHLCMALDIDVTWHRECARLTRLALDWKNSGEQAGALMRPADIKAAERVFERQPRNTEPPPSLLTDYLDTSRRILEKEIRKLRRVSGRGFVEPAQEALSRSANEHALRLVAAGALLADDPDFHLVPELWKPAQKAIFQNRTLEVLRGHQASISDTFFSPDGRRIATVSKDHTSRIWDAETESEAACLKTLKGAAAYSPDGKQLVTFDERTVQIFNAQDFEEIARFEDEDQIRSVAFSLDGSRIATLAGGAPAIWDTKTGDLIARASERSPVVLEAVALSPDGSKFVTASCLNLVRIFSAQTGDLIEPALVSYATAAVRAYKAAAFSVDGTRVIVTTLGDIEVWDVATGKSLIPIHTVLALPELIGNGFIVQIP